MKLRTIAASLLLLGLLGTAQAKDSQSFKSPEAAVAALQSTLNAEGNDALVELFGNSTEELLDNANPTQIEESRRLLKLLFEEQWHLAPTEDGSRILRLGEEGWPFPIPIVSVGSNWQFDTEAGLEELANRRIGRNELIAIETCKRLLDAEEDFRLRDPDNDGIREYTSLIRSSEGQFDGLYWEVAQGPVFSPLQTALVDSWKYAEGRVEGSPWFGYHFRFLEGQGPDAPGGAYSYTVNGHQVAGFGVVAYPANYGHSGIMTFLISSNGTLFEKDLGEKTQTICEKMKTFNPDQEWSEVTER